MSLLKRDEILQADDLETRDVFVKAWNGNVRIRTMTAKERDDFEQMIFGGDKKGRMENVRASLVALTAIDEDGNRLFTTKDVKALSQKSGAAMSQVFNEAQRLNRMTNEDVEEIAKNSDGTPEDNSDGE